MQNKPNLHFTTEKNNIFVSGWSIKRYALYSISPRSLRTRRLMKNKANLPAVYKIPEMNITSAITVNYINELRTTNYELIMKNKAKKSQLNWGLYFRSSFFHRCEEVIRAGWHYIFTGNFDCLAVQQIAVAAGNPSAADGLFLAGRVNQN